MLQPISSAIHPFSCMLLLKSNEVHWIKSQARPGPGLPREAGTQLKNRGALANICCQPRQCRFWAWCTPVCTLLKCMVLADPLNYCAVTVTVCVQPSNKPYVLCNVWSAPSGTN